MLGLDLAAEAGRLRFYYGPAPLPETEELVARLDAMVGDLVVRHQEAERLAEQERQRADLGERRIAELEAELDRLRQGGRS